MTILAHLLKTVFAITIVGSFPAYADSKINLERSKDVFGTPFQKQIIKEATLYFHKKGSGIRKEMVDIVARGKKGFAVSKCLGVSPNHLFPGAETEYDVIGYDGKIKTAQAFYADSLGSDMAFFRIKGGGLDFNPIGIDYTKSSDTITIIRTYAHGLNDQGQIIDVVNEFEKDEIDSEDQIEVIGTEVEREAARYDMNGMSGALMVDKNGRPIAIFQSINLGTNLQSLKTVIELRLTKIADTISTAYNRNIAISSNEEDLIKNEYQNLLWAHKQLIKKNRSENCEEADSVDNILQNYLNNFNKLSPAVSRLVKGVLDKQRQSQ